MTMQKPQPQKRNTGGQTKTEVTNKKRDTLKFVKRRLHLNHE